MNIFWLICAKIVEISHDLQQLSAIAICKTYTANQLFVDHSVGLYVVRK